MSAAMVVSTSLDRLGRMPASSACWIGGMPWRMAISIGQAMESQPPVSLTRRIWSGGVGEVDVDVVRPHQPFVAELHHDLRTEAGLPPTTWVKMRRPNLRASSHCSLLTAVPSASVTSWSVEAKCCFCKRSTSPGYFAPGPEPRE